MPKSYKRKVGASKRSRRLIGYKTTAMPLSRRPKSSSIPRSLGYKFLSDTFRVCLQDSKSSEFSLLSEFDDITQQGRFFPRSFFCSPVDMRILESTNYPFQLNRLLSLYSKAQVDYVTYTISVTLIGGVFDTQNPNPSKWDPLINGMNLATTFIARSDLDTFDPEFIANDNSPTSVVKTLPYSKLSQVHAGGNHDTVVHKHALDIGTWFKDPSSSLRQITSEFPPPGAPIQFNWSPTINIPDDAPSQPALLIVVDTPSGIPENDNANMYFQMIISAEYHISFSEPHIPVYGGSFPIGPPEELDLPLLQRN